METEMNTGKKGIIWFNEKDGVINEDINIQNVKSNNKSIKNNSNSNDELIYKILEEKEKFKKILIDTYEKMDMQFEKYIEQIKMMRNKNQNSKLQKDKDKQENKVEEEKITNSFKLNKHFFESIEDLLGLYNNFINSFDSKTNINNFIIKNQKLFIDSWIVQKFDTKNKNMQRGIEELITQSIKICISKSSKSNKFKFQEKDEVKERLKYFFQNKSNIKKLKFHKRKKSDFDELFPINTKYFKEVKLFNGDIIEDEEYKRLLKEKEELEKENDPYTENYNLSIEKLYHTQEREMFPNIKSIKIKRCSFAEVELWEKFPHLTYLKIENSTFNLTKLGNRYLKNLRKLELNKMGITDGEFYKIFESIFKNKDLLKNLEYLSFEENKITKLEYTISNMLNDEEKQKQKNLKFDSLTELNFENNKVYKVSHEFLMLFPKLRLLNLNLNNFAFENSFLILQGIFKNKNVLLLMNKNLFSLKNRFHEKYLNFFFDSLKKFNFFLKKLSFETVFCKFTINKLPSKELHPHILEHIKILNISYCYLTDDILIKFLKHNSNGRNLINLKSLIVESNYLTEKFFDLFLDNNLDEHFEALETIDFTRNEKIVPHSYLLKLLQFLNVLQLRKMLLFRTNFEDNIMTFLRAKFYEKKPQNVDKNEKAKSGNNLLINNYSYFFDEIKNMNLKTKFYIGDFTRKQMLTSIQNVYNKPFENLIFQNKIGE